MTVSPWLIGTLISLAALGLTASAFVLGRRKDREKKLVADTTERTEIKSLLKTQSDKLDSMDRSISVSLSEIKQQHGVFSDRLADHDKRIFALECARKMKED